MPMPAQKPTTTPIPVQLSESEFHESLLLDSGVMEFEDGVY
jgi:hypothetical protein